LFVPIIDSVVAQHAEDAAFLWLLREAGCDHAHFGLPDLAKLDERVEANLDGLRIADGAGVEICKECWTLGDAGEVFAALELAFESSNAERIAVALEVAASAPELSRGAVSALGWLRYEQASPHIGALLGLENPNLRRIGLGGSVAHRRDPGEALVRAMLDENSRLRGRALRAVGELGRVDLLRCTMEGARTDDIDCRFSAAWSSALLGDTGTVDVLKSIVQLDGPHSEEATRIACRRMDVSTANEWQRELARTPGCERLAVMGAGAIGDPAAIPCLVEQMRIAPLARVAGEAFTMITGVDIAYEDLEGEWPEGFEAGPTENPEDENVEMDPDENLPWPNLALIEAWWAKNRGRFRTGTRYLVGQPIAYEHLQKVLRTGYQRQRAAAAIELAMLKPGQPLFEVRAPGFRQQELLGLGRRR
jgi:uncharacterized protein (TIGR02270 family)